MKYRHQPYERNKKRRKKNSLGEELATAISLFVSPEGAVGVTISENVHFDMVDSSVFDCFDEFDWQTGLRTVPIKGYD
jgi:hypothetical protein